jgi:hypothetical protein
MLLEEKALQAQILESQVERILHSDELRTSEVLRQILRYLMEKTLSGEADQLKEYTVAIDGLGKSTDYDPQHNSAVRLQVGRLRQKLAEYYRAEGKNDSVIIDIPKGRFKVTCEVRGGGPAVNPVDPSWQGPAAEPLPGLANPIPISKPTAFPLSGFPSWLAMALALALIAFFLGRWSSAASKSSALKWTPELQTLWGPFVDSNRPLIISIEDPLFVEMRSYPGAYFRDRTLNSWAEVMNSQTISGMRNLFKNNDMQPSRHYTTFGEADASFLSGNLLGPHARAVSFVRSSQMSFQQLADNNVIFIGVQNLFFDEKLQALPIATQLTPVLEGVRDVRPAKGEPGLFVDHYSTAPTEEGLVYALISHLPGPLDNSDVESFTSNCAAGYLGAVQWLADAESAKLLVAKMKDSSGHVPRYYQVLLKVKFKDDVPIETTYVLSRVLG